MEITAATGFDASKQEEKFETIELTDKKAKEIIETLLTRLDYQQAKAWIDNNK